jgi:hypothetical protein
MGGNHPTSQHCLAITASYNMQQPHHANHHAGQSIDEQLSRSLVQDKSHNHELLLKRRRFDDIAPCRNALVS